MFVLSAHDRWFVGFQFGLDPVEPFDDLVNAAIQAGCQIVDPVIQASSEIVDTLIDSLEMFFWDQLVSPNATMIGSATWKNGSFHYSILASLSHGTHGPI